MKVSVIVPTYRSGPHLDHLIASLDAQTLPRSEFEAIFVDDGSPDQTYDRLERIAATRPWVRLHRIPNSGWPSRPRNLGVRMAVGDYVLFLDHDDVISPRTLERGWELGSRNRADAVNLKESRTELPGWALPIFDHDWDNALGRTDHTPIGPLTPHKLYRRGLLLDHDIRFPEGGRVPNEDLYFNIDVMAHAEVISILAEEPGYHWVHTGSNNSTAYLEDAIGRLESITKVLDYAAERLAGFWNPSVLTNIRLELIQRQVLSTLAEAYLTRREDLWPRVDELCRPIIEQHVPDDLVERFDVRAVGVLELYRRGRLDLFADLFAWDLGLYGFGTAQQVEWVDGRLRVAYRTVWEGPRPVTPQLRADGDRFRAVVSSALDAELGAGLFDVTEAVLASKAIPAVRSRADGSSWLLDGTTTVTPLVTPLVAADAEGHTLEITGSVDIDVGRAIFGRPMLDPLWDVYVRSQYLVGHNQRRLRTSTPRRVALIDGRCAIAYRTNARTLALDLAMVFGDPFSHGAPDLGAATLLRRGPWFVLRVPLTQVHVAGRTRLPIRIELDPGDTVVPSPRAQLARRLRRRVLRSRVGRWVGARGRATLAEGDGMVRARAAFVGHDGSAWLESRVRVPRGRSRLTLLLGDRRIETDGYLERPPSGPATITRQSATGGVSGRSSR